jgi:Xaa-Pro aminopeptidase
VTAKQADVFPILIKDLDTEMDKRGVSGIVVLGETTLANPDLAYAVGGNLARGGLYFKRKGHKPLLLVSNLDVGTARKLRTVRRIETYTHWGFERLVKKHRLRDEAMAHLITTVLNREGISGKVGLFGRSDLASGIHLVSKLRTLGVKIVGGQSPTILESARETKEAREIDQIRDVGRRTADIVAQVIRELSRMRSVRGHFQIGKRPATVGLVKSIISGKIASEGLIAPEGTIFAIGPSGADPHNSGVSTNRIREGQLIVFDIFPQAESGYWFDLTRTYMIGRAGPKAKHLFETVRDAQAASLDVINAGMAGEAAMNVACDVVERAGYTTVRDVYEGRSKNVSSGFNHSLGHGVGLTIGERPYLGLLSKDPLRAGGIVTVEPGVYLPKYGGVRIEDTVMITQKGYEQLVQVDKELEIA